MFMTEPTPQEYLKFTRHLRTYIARRVDAAYVDDIVGEILLRVATHRDQFNQAGNPLAWLHTVANNLIADHYRRKAVEKTVLQRLQQEATEEEEEVAADSYQELAPCLLPMIEALPESYREALLKTDIQGLTQTESAAHMGLSISGMKSRVQRGRDKLKDALLRCCEVELNRRGRIVGYTPRGKRSPCSKTCK